MKNIKDTGMAVLAGMMLTGATLAQPVKMKPAKDMKPIRHAETSLRSVQVHRPSLFLDEETRGPDTFSATYRTFDGTTTVHSGTDDNRDGKFSLSEVKMTSIDNEALGINLTIVHDGTASSVTQRTNSKDPDGTLHLDSKTLPEGSAQNLMDIFSQSIHRELKIEDHKAKATSVRKPTSI